MEEKIEKLIEKLEEREDYLIYRYEEAVNEETEDYYMGKWSEVNKLRKELQEILDEE